MTRTLLLTVFFLVGTFATGLQAKPRFQVEVAEAYIDLRSGPGKAYPVFYVGQRGEQLTVHKRRGVWYKVEMRSTGDREVIGWTHRDALGKTLVVGSRQLAAEHTHMNPAYEPRFTASFALGRFSGEGESDSVAGILAWHATELMDLELHAGQWVGNTEEGWYANGQLVYVPFRDWYVKPFVAVGYGHIERRSRGTNILQFDNSDNFLLSGSGLQVRIGRQYELRLEYRHFNTLTSKDDNSELEQWQLGLSASF